MEVPYVAIARLARPEPIPSSVTVAMSLMAFFDESGKWQESDFICLCGYLSDEEGWTKFANRWRGLLAKHEFAFIHVAEFYAQCHKRGWTRERADEVLAEFCDPIRDHALVGFAVAFDSKRWRAERGDRRKRIPDPARFCIMRALRIMRNRLAQDGHPGQMALFFDEDEEYAVKCYRAIAGLRRRQPEVRTMISSITFTSDEIFYPLQAADILANLSNKYLREKARTSADEPGPVLTRLLSHPTVPGRGTDVETEEWDPEVLAKHGY